MKRRRRFGERFPRRNTIAAAYRPCSDTEPLEKVNLLCFYINKYLHIAMEEFQLLLFNSQIYRKFYRKVMLLRLHLGTLSISNICVYNQSCI